MTSPYLSVVVPVYNEEEALPSFLDELKETLQDPAVFPSYEVILVDDGSSDGTAAIMGEWAAQWPNMRFFSHSRNLGQTFAMSVGFEESRGQVVVPLDADGQNDPADIVTLVTALEQEGLDCVSGWRRHRSGDNGLRVPFSRVANWLLQRASGLSIHDSGCTLKAFRGSAARHLQLFGDMHRLLPFQVALQGGLVGEIEVNHRQRFAGQSKYNLSRTFRVLQDVVVAFFLRRFLYRPMHLLGSIGSLVIFLGVFAVISTFFLKVFEVRDFVETPLLLVGSVLIIGGLNMLGIGLLSEALLRFVGSSQGRPFPLARRVKHQS